MFISYIKMYKMCIKIWLIYTVYLLRCMILKKVWKIKWCGLIESVSTGIVKCTSRDTLAHGDLQPLEPGVYIVADMSCKVVFPWS